MVLICVLVHIHVYECTMLLSGSCEGVVLCICAYVCVCMYVIALCLSLDRVM
jgi:hypothetical protein